MYKLVLASQSPRRKQLLSEAGFSHLELPIQVSETPSKNLTPEEQILDIARRKARACLHENKYLESQNYLILSADTEVVLDGQLLGKPESAARAKELLRLLSGRGHQVITGICLINCSTLEQYCEVTTTQISFRVLSDAEIDDYIASGEPFDKAGGYGIQGAGGKFVSQIEGPFDNVVGLPMQTLKSVLQKKGWSIDG